jgi:hypothetical protein
MTYPWRAVLARLYVWPGNVGVRGQVFYISVRPSKISLHTTGDNEAGVGRFRHKALSLSRLLLLLLQHQFIYLFVHLCCTHVALKHPVVLALLRL